MFQGRRSTGRSVAGSSHTPGHPKGCFVVPSTPCGALGNDINYDQADGLSLSVCVRLDTIQSQLLEIVFESVLWLVGHVITLTCWRLSLGWYVSMFDYSDGKSAIRLRNELLR